MASSAPETTAPRPVVPIPLRSRAVTSVLTLVLFTAIVSGVCSLARPVIIVETVSDATHYRVDPDSIRRTAALLALTIATSITLLRRQPDRQGRTLVVIPLVVAVVCFVPLWHQYACHVIVTPDSVTAPLRGGLFPAGDATVNFDTLSDIFFQGERTGPRYQIFRTKTGQRIDLDFGPAYTQASAQVEAATRAHTVRIKHSF